MVTNRQRTADLRLFAENEPSPSLMEIRKRIARAKAWLGDRLVILGHHYQADDVIEFADFVGDSLKLSRQAASRSAARYIVFCGVRFMAETADVLSSPDQAVFLPNPDAGCPMADMAGLRQVRPCWGALGRLSDDKVTPITYINSSAELKAFCGRNGGVVCTSSNAAAVMKWALGNSGRLLFFPDEHLGRNTGLSLGLPPETISVWDPEEESLPGDHNHARLILWDGFCPVHVDFTPGHVEEMRRRHPGVRVIVHPECPHEVVRSADDTGSTEHIIECIRSSEPGSRWAVGTDIRLVRRLARQHPEKEVFPLAESVPPCLDMGKINPLSLLRTLEGLLEGETKGCVRVKAETAKWARVALERMLAIA